MKTTYTKAAFIFLSERNPLDIPQAQYVNLLMEFQSSKGDKALQGLAGFYIYAIRSERLKKDDRMSQAIASTFSHDLGGRNDKWCEPRSSSYVETWEDECLKFQGVEIDEPSQETRDFVKNVFGYDLNKDGLNKI